LKRTAIALATVVAIAGCKKNEPVTAAPIAPAPGIPTAAPPGGMPPAGMPPGGMPPQAMPPGGALAGAPAGAEQRIAIAKQLVAQNPKDVQAWISLGNDYFDTKQHQAAIDAYANALALDPKNPDVLTDQGVMYRERRRGVRLRPERRQAGRGDLAQGHRQRQVGALRRPGGTGHRGAAPAPGPGRPRDALARSRKVIPAPHRPQHGGTPWPAR
jgi:hypothetical protein